MTGFVDYLRMAMGWWSGFESTTPDPIEGVTLRLRTQQQETQRLLCQQSVTMKLRTTQGETLRLRVIR